MLYALTWLSGVLCYCVYKLGGSSVGRGFEGRATAQQRGRRRDLGNFLAKSTFSQNSRLQL